MFFFLKQFLIQFLICFFGSFLTIGLPLLGLTDHVDCLDHPIEPGMILFGIAMSLFIYFIGFTLGRQFFASRDVQLIPFTPLTPARLFWRGVQRNAGFLFGFLVYYPAILLWLFYGQGVKRPEMAPLAGVNLVLTYLVLLLYPLHRQFVARPWDLFFLLLKPLRLLGRSAGFLAIILIAGERFFQHPLLAGIAHLQNLLLAQGTLGLVALYLLAPLAGLIYFIRPDVPPSLPPILTACLAALLVLCLRSVVRMFRAKMETFDLMRTEWWVEHREEVETREEDSEQQRQRSEERPWAGNALREGIDPEATPPAPARETRSAERGAWRPQEQPVSDHGSGAAAPPPLTVLEVVAAGSVPPTHLPEPESSQLDYREDLPAPAQIRRHLRYWHPSALTAILNPWLAGALLAATAAYAAWGPRLVKGAPALPSRPDFLIIFLLIFCFIVQGAQTSGALAALTHWAYLLPLSWPRQILRHAFWSSRPRLGFDLLLILAFFILAGSPLELLAVLPVLFTVNRLVLGVAVWFSSLASVGGRRSRAVRNLYGIAYFSVVVMGLIGGVATASDQRDSITGAAIAQALLCLTVALFMLLIPALPVILWRRLWADYQMMSHPAYKMFKMNAE